MEIKRIVLKILSMLLIAVMVITISPIGQIVSIAKDLSEPKTLTAQFRRHIGGEDKEGYALNTGGQGHPVFQIIDEDGKGGYYCLNATKGLTWSQYSSEGSFTDTSVDYNQEYNLEDEEDLKALETGVGELYQKLAKSPYLKQIIWILKNIYIFDDDPEINKKNKNTLLAKAGIVYTDIEADSNPLDDLPGEVVGQAYKYIPTGDKNYLKDPNATQGIKDTSVAQEGWYYFKNEGSTNKEKFVSVEISDEIVEVAQQAALWYYTNFKDNEQNEMFDIRTKGLQLKCSHETTGAPQRTENLDWTKWKPLTEQYEVETDTTLTVHEGAYLQDQATILSWYLIDAADEFVRSGGTYNEEPLKLAKPTQVITQVPVSKINNENCYVLGPIKIEEDTTMNYTLSNTINVNNKDITNYYILNSADATTSDNKTIADEVGKEFYLAIPGSEVAANDNITSLDVKINGTYSANNELVLKDGATGVEQPVTYVKPVERPIQLALSAKLTNIDLALTKFITAISEDAKIEDGEYLTADKKVGSKTNPYTRATSVDTTGLKTDLTCHDAVYNMVKTPLQVPVQAYVLYNIRVYNEGNVDVYAGEVKDHLPDYLEFVEGNEINTKYGWTLSEDKKTVTTKYLEYKEGETTHLLKKFDRANDDTKGSGLDYEDLPILCRVKDTAPNKTKFVNTAEVSKYQDDKGQNVTEDVDSQPDNRQKKNDESREQDDDDWEVVYIDPELDVDLALTKFITAVSTDTKIEDGEYITADGKIGSKTNPYLRATGVDTSKLLSDPECHDADYTLVKEPPLTVPAQAYVLYNIRIYNEGDTDVYAGEVTDHLPEYLDYVYCDFNDNFEWKLDEDGKTIRTNYLEYKENDASHLLKAFDREKDDGKGSGLSYQDLQVLCRVSDKAPTNKAIVNVAEITKYQDDKGKDITEDIDSTPDNVDKKNEDDDDYEQVIVKVFDLSLLKWVSTVYVTEDGKTTTTQTGNTGDDSKDIIPKVEINRKKLDSTVVKFGWTIKITNEGDIAGYAKEITDYVPEGLKFYSEDNNGWKDEGNNIISTRLLENTLLQPGESAEVTVILRWINGADNLSMKTNVAEISEDYNDEGVPDRDSTPDNQKPGEDDIDDASVLLAISTGGIDLLFQIMKYTSILLGITILFVGEYKLLKKYVL